MEVQDTRAISGHKPEAPKVEINGPVAGFIPAFDRVLIKRLPPPPAGLIVRPEVAQEQSERGIVIAVGDSKYPMPPIGAIASFSKFCDEKHFDGEGSDRYVIPWNVDVRGWHNVPSLPLGVPICEDNPETSGWHNAKF